VEREDLSIGTTDASAFEALFIRGVSPPPDLRIALLGIGVDLDGLEMRYSSVQWIAAIDLGRSYLFPGAPSVDEAERELGRKFTAGFLRTLPGRLLGAVLPFMTPESIVHRLPRYVRMGRDDLDLAVERLGERLWRIVITDPATARPNFFAGMMEAGLERLSTPSSVEVQELDELRFELLLRVG
jgi:uncharacterized protein (TIGR02265 family)